MRVAVLGASPNPERYSNKAMRMLKKHGHEAVPVTPGHKEVEGTTAVASLAALPAPVDTVTVYVGPAHIGPLIDGIVAAKPRRVIMNPGAESPELAKRAQAAGIEVVEACTLVLLSTGQF
jgi:predicted CoA-binding protein